MVGRSFQCVRALYERENILILMFVQSRGLHSALFSTIGAVGFLASAVLPPDAYSVSFDPLAC